MSHHRISSTDSKVRTALHVSIIDSGSERVNATRSWVLEMTSSIEWCYSPLGEEMNFDLVQIGLHVT